MGDCKAAKEQSEKGKEAEYRLDRLNGTVAKTFFHNNDPQEYG